MLLDFGFGFWVLCFVIFLGCGKMCGWGARKYKERHHELDPHRPAEDDRLSNLESRIGGLDSGRREREQLPRPAMFRRDEKAEPEPARLKSKRPSALERLQKEFIEGKLSLDEYERELDRLERIE